MKELTTYKGVTSARRLPNGHTRIAGVGLDGGATVVVLELDEKDVSNPLIRTRGHLKSRDLI